MRRGGLVFAFVLAAAAPAAAAEIELKNDGFVDGGGVGVQSGFVADEIAAVRLTPPGSGPYTLTRVHFFFGGATTTQTVTLKIYADGTGASPGAELYSGDYEVTGSSEALQEINLAGEGVVVSGPFRVGIVLHHADVPSVARDDDGSIAQTENFMYALGIGWTESYLLGLSGDWIIRAFVDDGSGPGTPDAAPPGTPDAAAGLPDAGSAGECTSNGDCAVGEYCNELGACSFDCREDGDCGDDMACNSLGMCVAAEGGDSGGCGCRAGGPAPTPPWGVWLLLAAAVWRFRRR